MPIQNRPHIKLNTNRQTEGSVALKFNYGSPDEEEEDESSPNPNYKRMAMAFQGYLSRFNADYDRRQAARNQELQVPEHIDYIRILFQSQFSIKAGVKN